MLEIATRKALVGAGRMWWSCTTVELDTKASPKPDASSATSTPVKASAGTRQGATELTPACRHDRLESFLRRSAARAWHVALPPPTVTSLGQILRCHIYYRSFPALLKFLQSSTGTIRGRNSTIVTFVPCYSRNRRNSTPMGRPLPTMIIAVGFSRKSHSFPVSMTFCRPVSSAERGFAGARSDEDVLPSTIWVLPSSPVTSS